MTDQDRQVYPPTHIWAREMAQRIRQMHGDPKPIWSHWVSQFKKRHPEVSSSLGRRIKKSKKRAVPPVKIMPREDVLESMRLKKLGKKAEKAPEGV